MKFDPLYVPQLLYFVGFRRFKLIFLLLETSFLLFISELVFIYLPCPEFPDAATLVDGAALLLQ
jgi:hypothetical protein